MLVDNFEEYEDPMAYDSENETYKEDLPFLMKWAAKIDGTIIDLACGTGRVTIPLAKKGYKLVGVDIHKGMLAEARRKSANQHLPIKWIEQDCTNLHLNAKSRFIFTVGNSFQHFLMNKSQDGLLDSVNRHLELGGIFIFGTRFPSAEALLQPSTEEYWKTYVDNDTMNKVDVYTISKYDPLTQVQHYITIRRMINKAGEIIEEKKTNILLRYTYPREMERILSANGFEIVDLYQDWNETSITDDSTQMVYVCKKVK
ncbi:class I SAM-dependent methyltransferase [Cytobacillus solani]|uniref:class I SAM-dependent methyltransferase n=1 Tax=Cytobacillus solani TaxID=1637975 RepID=UPI002079DC30|nr:class I SAM-dependent methyltransferase [Cytobacillus solani]USK53177.1 class I SAM-dependent methyltransferase [Cytobacillus solani]